LQIGSRPTTETPSGLTCQPNRQHCILFPLDWKPAARALVNRCSRKPRQTQRPASARGPSPQRREDPCRRSTLWQSWVRVQEAQDGVETHLSTPAPLAGGGTRLRCRRWRGCREGVRRNAPRLLSRQAPERVPCRSLRLGRTSRRTSSASWSAAYHALTTAPGCAPYAARGGPRRAPTGGRRRRSPSSCSPTSPCPAFALTGP
jgi:hypothetical protein